MTAPGTVPLDRVTLDRVIGRVGEIWHPGAEPHQIIFGKSGSGKTTLAQQLLRQLCDRERVLIFEPKQHDDPAWSGPDDDPYRWGRPVTEVAPRFGFSREPGGGPAGLWYRLRGTPDRAGTARRFAAALDVVQAEGHCILLLDDVVAVCRELNGADRHVRLAQQVSSVLGLGRSAGLLAILSTTETSYVGGRSQAGIVWVGATSGTPAAKAGADLIGHSDKAWSRATGGVLPHTWLYADKQPGSAGPVLAS